MRLRGHLDKEFNVKRFKRAYRRSLKLEQTFSSDEEDSKLYQLKQLVESKAVEK
jgi:hypothetical protein